MSARTQCDCCHGWINAETLHWSVGDRVCELCWASRVEAHADTVCGMMMVPLPFRCWHGLRRGALLKERVGRSW